MIKNASLLTLFLLFGTGAQASSLSVYQDKSIYSYVPRSNFIGLSQAVAAKCEGVPINLHTTSTCPLDKRLCKVLEDITKIQGTLKVLQANRKVLSTLMTLPQPTSFDASVWIDTAKSIGEEQAKLESAIEKSNSELSILNTRLKKQTRAKQALISPSVCSGEIELTLPSGDLSFSTYYQADISDKNQIKVTQYLSVLNRSGVDIEADSAMFYYRRASQYVHPVSFSPWIIKEKQPIVLKNRSLQKRVVRQMNDTPTMELSTASMGIPEKTIAMYVDAREYQVKHIELPSTGVKKDIPLASWKSKLSCELKAYPYKNTYAFSVCSFVPKFQIDSHAWKVISKKKHINDNAVGEYKEDQYHLYTQIDQDIKIVRKRLVKKARETGIFGTTVHKKDGFTLTLTNKSDKVKSLTLTERIPTSENEEIKVKLLEIKSDKKFTYTVKKEGEIEMHLVLEPHENKKIELFFEISYDKTLSPRY